MTMLRLLLSILLFFVPLSAKAAEDMALRVEVEKIGDALHYPHEMVLITIRGDYKIPITLENLEQPDFPGMDWMQLGEDNWFETEDRGKRVVSFERRMALFPQRPGTFEIGVFRHVLTLTKPNGTRFDRVILSEPVNLDVAELPPQQGWWFPVRRLGIDDSWSNAPQSLNPGEGVLRKILLTVEGAQPEMIPPMPEITGEGVAILPHPEVRRTLLRARGPVTQVFWRWTIRPMGDTSGYVDPFELRFFDALAREDRTIVISAQRVAYEDAVGIALRRGTVTGDAAIALEAKTSDGTKASKSGFSIPVHLLTPFAMLMGMFAGMVLLQGEMRGLSMDGIGLRVRHWWKRQGHARALSKSIRAGDAVAARRTAKAWLGEHYNGRSSEAIAGMDRHLFGSSASTPDFVAFGREIRAHARQIGR